MPAKNKKTYTRETVQSYLRRGYIITAETEHFVSVKKPINHALHIILTLLTFWILGGWLWVYLCIVFLGGGRVNIEK